MSHGVTWCHVTWVNFLYHVQYVESRALPRASNNNNNIGRVVMMDSYRQLLRVYGDDIDGV